MFLRSIASVALLFSCVSVGFAQVPSGQSGFIDSSPSIRPYDSPYTVTINDYETYREVVIESSIRGDFTVLYIEKPDDIQSDINYSETYYDEWGALRYSVEWKAYVSMRVAMVRMEYEGVSSGWQAVDYETGATDSGLLDQVASDAAVVRDRVRRMIDYFLGIDSLEDVEIITHRTLGGGTCWFVECCVLDYGPGVACHECCSAIIPPLHPNTDCDGLFDSMRCCRYEATRDYCHRLCDSNPGSVLMGTIEYAFCFVPLRGFF